MAVEYPIPDDVKQAFADALPAGGQFDKDQWTRQHRSVLDPRFQPAGQGVEVLQAADNRLIRVNWEFGIDQIDTRSMSKMISEASGLRQRVAAAVGGQPVAFDAVEYNVDERGPIKRVSCLVRGIIG
jgi:hypothetical protein